MNDASRRAGVGRAFLESNDIVRAWTYDLNRCLIPKILAYPKHCAIEGERAVWVNHRQRDMAKTVRPDHWY